MQLEAALLCNRKKKKEEEHNGVNYICDSLSPPDLALHLRGSVPLYSPTLLSVYVLSRCVDNYDR